MWWLAAIGNSGAMTLYLWHMPALLGMHLVFDYLGWARYPGEPNLIVLSVAQTAVMTVLVAALFVALRPLENTRCPAGTAARSPHRAAQLAVGVLLCVAGAATLISVKWGLKDQGADCTALTLVALCGARLLARPAVTAAPAASRRGARSAVSAAPAGR